VSRFSDGGGGVGPRRGTCQFSAVSSQLLVSLPSAISLAFKVDVPMMHPTIHLGIIDPYLMEILMKNSLPTFFLLACITTPALWSQQPDSIARPRGGPQPIMEKAPLAKSDFEKRILQILQDIDQNQRRGSMSVPVIDGRLLRLLTETTGATNVVEIGTSIGYSGLWFCLALQSTGGHLTTFEIDEGRAAQARKNFNAAGVEKLVTVILGDAPQNVTRLKSPIDILFLDADKEGYIDYLNKLLPLVRPGGLIIAHNMNTRQADPKFVDFITTNPGLESLFLNKELTGIGVTLKKR